MAMVSDDPASAAFEATTRCSLLASRAGAMVEPPVENPTALCVGCRVNEDAHSLVRTAVKRRVCRLQSLILRTPLWASGPTAFLLS